MGLVLNFILLLALLYLVNYKQWAMVAAVGYAVVVLIMFLVAETWAPVAIVLAAILFGVAWLWFWLLILTEESEAWWFVLFGGLFLMFSWPMYL